MTPDEHAAEAEKLLTLADSTYMDDADGAGPREAYATEEDWARALETGLEAHRWNVQLAALFAQMATAHATLAAAGARPTTTVAAALECAKCGDTDGPFAERGGIPLCERCAARLDEFVRAGSAGGDL